MLTKPNARVANNRRSRTRAKPPRPTLDDKRQAVLEWFASDATICEFRAGEKNVPRPFIRKAADALGLRELRKKRTEDGVFEIVEAKVMVFRPGAVDGEKKKSKLMAETKPDAANAKGPKLTIDQKRQFVLEWFASDSSIRDFRRGDKTVPRPFIRKASRALDLEDLRKKRDEEGISEIVADKVNDFSPRKQGKGRELGKAEAASGVDRPKLSIDEKREFVLEWFASDESIRDFRAGEKNVPRPFIREAANALGLRELRKKREQDGVQEIAAEKIMSFRPKKGGDSPVVDRVMLPAFNPEWMKIFLLEWFDDAKMRGIPRLLKDRGAADAQRTVMRLVKASSLRKLRKERENPDTRDAAIAAISKAVETAAVATVYTCQKKLENMELGHEKVLRSRDLHRAELSQGSDGDMKGLLLQWYDSEEMRSIGKVLRENGALDMKDTMTDLITKNGLRKLRKDREKPEARKKAMEKIEKILLSPSAAADSDGKNELSWRAKKEKLRGLLLEFFFDDEMLSVHDFLESRGEADLQKDMGRCVRKLRLNKLKKDRVKLRQKVAFGIEDLFRKKAKFVTTSEIGGGKGDDVDTKEVY